MKNELKELLTDYADMGITPQIRNGKLELTGGTDFTRDMCALDLAENEATALLLTDYLTATAPSDTPPAQASGKPKPERLSLDEYLNECKAYGVSFELDAQGRMLWHGDNSKVKARVQGILTTWPDLKAEVYEWAGQQREQKQRVLFAKYIHIPAKAECISYPEFLDADGRPNPPLESVRAWTVKVITACEKGITLPDEDYRPAGMKREAGDDFKEDWQEWLNRYLETMRANGLID